MAMEERQRQIKEGAGLEESRLNTEFIEMMKKWGPHLLTVVAVIAGLWAARDWWTRHQEAKHDEAFASFEKALPTDNSPLNPAVLEKIAEEHASGTAVPLQARTLAADIHLTAARTGIPLGEKLDNDNQLPAGKNFLTDDEKKQELAKAEALFKAVASDADSSLGQTQYAIASLTGLASIAEDRGEFDKAKDYYQQAMAKATDKKLDQLEALIKKRIETLDLLKTPVRLYASAELPGGGEKPFVQPMGGITARTDTGQTIQLGGPKPDGTPGAVQIPGGGTLVPVSPPTITDASGTRPATPQDVKPPVPTPAPTPPTPPAPAPDKPAEKPAETPPTPPTAPKPAAP